MIAPARIAAYDALLAVARGDADLPTAIDAQRHTLADERDRALLNEIASGTERWRATLDHLIEHFSRRRLPQLDLEVLTILRLSAYQLLHLTRVPAPAVVDDAVDFSRRVGKRSASGFVNAVLRAITRSRRALPLPPRPDSSGHEDRRAAIAYLSVTLSHPAWLATRWLDRFGFEEAEAWLQFNNRPAPLTLRANRLRTTAAALAARMQEQGVGVQPGHFGPDALVLDERQRLGEIQPGDAVVQDEASQLVALLAGRRPGGRVLDVCAAPGGKTTALAAMMNNAGLLVACDMRRKRVALLARTVAACGASCVRLVRADGTRPLPFTGRFDCVLVDAPCSGLGVLRRDPDIRWRRTETELADLADTQLAMLTRAADVVAPGGRLIYATCSSEPEENEDVVGRFLQSGRPFAPIDLRTADTDLPPSVVDGRGHLRTSPALHGLEAFFGAAFERSGGDTAPGAPAVL